uniref:Uncharacterized protein n=1 Tax=Podarcis muralis TaxID=64176 RepID=A0A670IQ42_PODMU
MALQLTQPLVHEAKEKAHRGQRQQDWDAKEYADFQLCLLAALQFLFSSSLLPPVSVPVTKLQHPVSPQWGERGTSGKPTSRA